MNIKVLTDGKIMMGMEIKMTPIESLLILQALNRLSVDEEISEGGRKDAAKYYSQIMDEVKKKR